MDEYFAQVVDGADNVGVITDDGDYSRAFPYEVYLPLVRRD